MSKSNIIERNEYSKSDSVSLVKFVNIFTFLK